MQDRAGDQAAVGGDRLVVGLSGRLVPRDRCASPTERQYRYGRACHMTPAPGKHGDGRAPDGIVGILPPEPEMLGKSNVAAVTPVMMVKPVN